VGAILTALSAANAATTPPAAGVPSTVAPGSLMGAINAANARAAAQRAQPKIGPAQGIIGPGPAFQPTSSSQQLQYVPAMNSPY
jgi:hypothetical protein